MKFMLISNNLELIQHAESAGVERIFVDLELLGKQERQGHLDTHITDHVMSDIAKVKAVLSNADLLVRLNPLNKHSKKEVDDAIDAGADLLMLPMFYDVETIQKFVDYVNGRVGVIPLVETLSASQCLAEIVMIKGISEIYIGLNDLSLELKLDFMFEPLANGLVDDMASIIKTAGLPFGFGGVARIGEGVIPGEVILGEHHRLGSSSVILSRTFHRSVSKNTSVNFDEFKREVVKLIKAADKLTNRGEKANLVARQLFQQKVNAFIVKSK